MPLDAGWIRAVGVAGLLAAGCGNGGPVTCENYANAEELCARLDGARFIDSGSDSATDATVLDAGVDAAEIPDSGAAADAGG